MELATLAFATVGALLAFLYYNITPAKIFMGDTGSLTLGLLCSVFVISFMEHNNTLIGKGDEMGIKSGPAVAIGIIMLPLFDTLRVMLIRIYRRRSPFYPDRTHIHHLLLDMGLNHMQATGVLLFVSSSFIALVYFLQDMGSLNLIVLLVFVALGLMGSLFLMKQRRQRFRRRQLLLRRERAHEKRMAERAGAGEESRRQPGVVPEMAES